MKDFPYECYTYLKSSCSTGYLDFGLDIIKTLSWIKIAAKLHYENTFTHGCIIDIHSS